MPNDYETIRDQALALIADITANPKPSYTIDKQKVDWCEYLCQLRKTVEWCNNQLTDTEPKEIDSIGYSD